MKQKPTELKAEIDKFTIIFRGFNTPLSITNKISRQKISKDKEYLNTINQLNLTDIYSKLQRPLVRKIKYYFYKEHSLTQSIFYAVKKKL